MDLLNIIYIIILQLVMLTVGIPLYEAKGMGIEISIPLLSFLISLVPPLLIFIFSLIKKDFLLTSFPLTLGLSSTIYYLRFSFADELLLGSLILSTFFCNYNSYLKKWDGKVNIYASNLFKILILLSIYSSFLGLFYRDIRIIKSILFVSFISLAWIQRRKIYSIVFNPKAPVYVLTGFCLALFTNIIHGLLQIFYNPLIFEFGSVDGALGIQGPQIGASIPFIFIYILLIQKRFILSKLEIRKIDNLLYCLSPLIIVIALITDSRTILLFYFFSITSYLFSRGIWSLKISKKIIWPIAILISTIGILIIIGNRLYDNSFYFLNWIFNLISTSFSSIIASFNQGEIESFEFIYQGNIMEGSTGDFGRKVFFIHGLLTPFLHPITILSGLGDYSFFVHAKESLDKISFFLSGEGFVNTLGYTIGDSAEIKFPKPPILANIILEKGLIFTILLFEYLRLIILSLIKSYGLLIASSLLFCIVISFISTNFEDNLSLILLISPPLILLNQKINNKFANN